MRSAAQKDTSKRFEPEGTEFLLVTSAPNKQLDSGTFSHTLWTKCYKLIAHDQTAGAVMVPHKSGSARHGVSAGFQPQKADAVWAYGITKTSHIQTPATSFRLIAADQVAVLRRSHVGMLFDSYQDHFVLNFISIMHMDVEGDYETKLVS